MRRLTYILSVLTLLILFSTTVAADDILARISTGYIGDEAEVFAPEDMNKIGVSGSHWGFSGDIARQRRRIVNGISRMTAFLYEDSDFMPNSSTSTGIEHSGGTSTLVPFDGNTALSLTYADEEIKTEENAVLSFGLAVEGVPGVTYPVSIHITAGGQEYKAQVSYVCTDADKSWTLVSADIRTVHGLLEKIEVRVHYDRKALPNSIMLTAPFARQKADTAFTVADRFSTDRLLSTVGSVTPSSGKVRPSVAGNAEISGRLLIPTQPSTGTHAFFVVTLSGVQSGGLTLGVSYEDNMSDLLENTPTAAENESAKADTATSASSVEEGQAAVSSNAVLSTQRYFTPKVALTAAESVYIFPIEVSGSLTSYTLLFDNIDCNVYFTIESVSVIVSQPSPPDGNPNIGTVSSILLSGNSVTFSGSMEREAVKSGGYLYFYALPSSAPSDLNRAIKLGSTKVSTRFTYTVDLSSMPALGDTALFFAAVHAEDADGSTLLLPLSKPRYGDASLRNETQVSVVGLSGAASVGAFESNVSHVLVDVPLDKLLTVSDGTSYSYINYDASSSDAEGSFRVDQLYFSRDFLDELDRDIQFYTSAGIRVYLRLYAASPIDGFTYGGEADSYLPDFSADGVRYRYAALVRFLSNRYSGIAGFVLGHGVNTEFSTGDITNGTSDAPTNSELSRYVSALAEMCRVTYNASSQFVTDALVIVPFTSQSEEGRWVSPRTLSVLLSMRLEDVGTFPWVLQSDLYADAAVDGAYNTSTELENAFSSLSSLQRLYDELELSFPDALTFFYQPDNDALLYGYGEFAESMRASGEDIPEYSRYAADRFSEIYEACAAYRTRAVFISLEGLSLKNDHAFYSDLKSVSSASDADPRSVYDSRAQVGQTITGNVLTLFDFSDAYHALGWIPGGGASSCLTEVSERFATDEQPYVRVLRSSFVEDMGTVDHTGSSTAGIAGIVLRNLSRAYDFTDIDRMEFSLSLEYADAVSAHIADDEGVTVVFVIGRDDYRAEYYASGLSIGEVQVLTCDLTGYEHRSMVDYVGIMVYANEDVVLDLATVRVGSDTMNEEELRSMFKQQKDSLPLNWGAATVAFLLTVGMTVILVILLTRREREEDELRDAALQKYRRK